MLRKTALVALVALLACGVASAQNHVNGYAGSSSSGSVFICDGLGKLSTVTAGTSTGYGLVMDRNNALLLVVNLDGNIYQIDPATLAVVGTVASGITSPRDIAVGQNGDYFISTSAEVYRLDASNALTTVASGLSTVYGGMDIDINTGDLLVQSRSGTDPLLRIARDGSSITTVASGGDPRYGITQHIPTGDVYTGSCCGDQSPSENVFIYPGGGPAATVWMSSALPPVGVYSIKADRASAANQQLILGAFGPSGTTRGGGGFFTIDVATKGVSLVTTLTPSLYGTEILYRRNLSSIAAGKGKWSIGIHVPEDAGRSYVLGVSASGVRPGVKLGDGRLINLLPDQVTFVGLTSGLAPFLVGGTGTLNTKGRATAKLDLSLIGSAANGVLLYFEVLVLDGKAPFGIQTITDPHVIKVEGM